MKNYYTVGVLVASTFLALAANVAFAANAPVLKANRTICYPQDHDMSTGPFTTVCDWNKWSPGDDTDALITLTGKQIVHADCTATGTNSVSSIRGMKQASGLILTNPGTQFGFDVGYNNDSNQDENQNLLIHLKTPLSQDKNTVLTCTFQVKQ